MILLSATMGPGRADEVSWSGPWGSAQTLSTSGVATALRARTNGSSGPEDVLLLYGDAVSLPAVAEAGVLMGSAHARALLSIEESNASGLDVIGQVSAESAGGAFSSSADVSLTLLLNPGNRAQILIRNIFESVTAGALPGPFLSLEIHRAAADGTSLGAALFSWNGVAPAPPDLSLGSDSPHYVITLAAHAEPGMASLVDFGFNLDFGAPVAVPEPACLPLLFAVAGVALGWRRR
ncbi:MAG: PEP-CTERM sorting domain-containing protein [Chthoniobacteraceae bacterium]